MLLLQFFKAVSVYVHAVGSLKTKVQWKLRQATNASSSFFNWRNWPIKLVRIVISLHLQLLTKNLAYAANRGSFF